MNRYWWFVLTLAAAALVVFSAVTIVAFSGGLAEQQHESHRRMEDVAAYCAEHIEESYSPDGLLREHHRIDQWLAGVSLSSGFERIVVADTLKLVHFSSHELILRGEDIAPYLVDQALFDSAARAREPLFTDVVSIDNTPFKSLYYPVRFADEPLVVVVGADEQYFALAKNFRNGVAGSALALVAVLSVLFGAVIAVSNRAAAARQRARRNEELAFLGRASAELAHEIKNPLGIIKSSTDVLRRKFDPEKSERAFGFLSDEIMRLSRQINDVLSFSRHKELPREPFNPRDQLHKARAQLVASFPEVAVSIDVPSHACLTGDADAFLQIASNLMRNAARAMDGSGRITITNESHRKLVRLCFADTGPGIDRHLIPTLFDPFVSGSKTGTGLGLAIVRTLCEASGWRIELRSAEKGNTCLCIDIPEEMWHES